jgi:hypothetical protein
MRTHEALRVEGTSRFEVPCYGVFRPSDFDFVSHASGVEDNSIVSRTYALFEEEWPCCVLLMEATTTNGQEIEGIVASVFSSMFQSGRCLAALCLYDGAFGGYGAIFSPALAEQTYAFCFSEGQHVVNFDDESLSSDEWKQVIEKCRLRLERTLLQSPVPG